MRPQVDVLMAAYNGEKYIGEQIDSILNQSHSHLKIYIRDDGSQDSTTALIEKKRDKNPGKICLIPSHGNQGVVQNFSTLMKSSTADYVMFSDQDDKWHHDKVEATLKKMEEMENKYGKKIPLLVHTDLHVVNEDLKEIHPSFWKYSKLYPERASFSRLLCQNVVTGCTMMMNRSLVELSQTIPPDAIMHDWWIALIAAAFGKIGVVDKPTMLYRQHASNQVGAKKVFSFDQLIRQFREKTRMQQMDARKQKQAKKLLESHEDKLTPEQKKLINVYCSLSSQNIFQRGRLMWSYGLLKSGFLRNLRLLFLGF